MLFMSRAQLIELIKNSRYCLVEGEPQSNGEPRLSVLAPANVLTVLSTNLLKRQWGYDSGTNDLIASVPEKWGVKDDVI